jgi:hypothetical protein
MLKMVFLKPAKQHFAQTLRAFSVVMRSKQLYCEGLIRKVAHPCLGEQQAANI